MKTLKALRKSVMKQMAHFSTCANHGNELRVPTTCVLPSFEAWYIHASRNGDRYIVHDLGQTFDSILRHGQEIDVAKRIIRGMCQVYRLRFDDCRISWEFHDPEWISSGILAVAAADAGSAECALHETHLKAQEARKEENADDRLAETVFSLLEPSLKEGAISRKFQHRGKSGRRYEFDLAIQEQDRLTLIETVTPHGHSVRSKYIALSDVPSGKEIRKISACDDNLAEEDILLLRNVAAIARPDDVGRMVAG